MSRSKFSCCDNISVQVLLQHFIVLSAFLSRQRLVATKLDFLSQLHSDVGTWLLGVVNICCRDPIFMSRQDSSVFSLLILSRPSLLCRDRTSLYYVEFFVATYKSLSRPRFSLFSLFLCCNSKIHVATYTYLPSLKYVATLGSFVVTRPVQQVSVICCDINFLIATELLLSVLSSISTSSPMLQESVSQQSRFCCDIDSAF